MWSSIILISYKLVRQIKIRPYSDDEPSSDTAAAMNGMRSLVLGMGSEKAVQMQDPNGSELEEQCEVLAG